MNGAYLFQHRLSSFIRPYQFLLKSVVLNPHEAYVALLRQGNCFELPVICPIDVTGPNPDRPLIRPQFFVLRLIDRYLDTIAGQDGPEVGTYRRIEEIIREVVRGERFAINLNIDGARVFPQPYYLCLQSGGQVQ